MNDKVDYEFGDLTTQQRSGALCCSCGSERIIFLNGKKYVGDGDQRVVHSLKLVAEGVCTIFSSSLVTMVRKCRGANAERDIRFLPRVK